MPYYGKSPDADLLDGLDSTYFALLNSPALIGTPTAPTATAGTNTTQLATTAMVHSAITNDLHVTGSAPMYACRAWVNFDGTTTSPTIRASGNISSIIKNGTGDYTVNFTTAMSDANYAATLMNADSLGGYYTPKIITLSGGAAGAAVKSATQLRIGFGASNESGDSADFNVSIFR